MLDRITQIWCSQNTKQCVLRPASKVLPIHQFNVLFTETRFHCVPRGVLFFLKFGRLSCELEETGSLGVPESEV